MVGEDFVDPIEEGVKEFRIVFQPSRMEVQSERSSVLLVVAVEVVVKEVVKLVPGEDVGAGVNHGASGEILVEIRIFSPVELV